MTVIANLLTQQEVADILRRDVKSVQRLRERGELGYLPGRPVLIPQAELDAYLERHMVKRQVVDAPAAIDRDAVMAAKARQAIEQLKRRGDFEELVELRARTRPRAGLRR